MKNSMWVLLGVLISTSAWAAKFQTISEMERASIEAVATVGNTIVKNESAFGDCTRMVRVSYTRKPEEKDINTVKQLNISKAGLWKDEDVTALDATGDDAGDIAQELLVNSNEEEFKPLVSATRARLKLALERAMKDRKVRVYTGGHSNEDGTWNVIDVLDTKNEEILLLRVGFCGT